MCLNTTQPHLDIETISINYLMKKPENPKRFRHEFEGDWWVLGLFDPASLGTAAHETP